MTEIQEKKTKTNLEKFNIKDTEGWTEKERKKEKKDASIESGFSVQIILGTVVAPPPHLP